MTDPTRELLRDAAPRPRSDPDFQQLWQRARRQRRRSRIAGAIGVVVLLAAVGVGLTRFVIPGERDLQVVDLLPPDPPVPGASQAFGEAETEAGITYAGRVRIAESDSFAGDAVCLSLRLDPTGGSSEGCGPLDDHLQRERIMWTRKLTPEVTAVAGWSPREADHLIWELPDGDHRFTVTEAHDLPGSLFVAAVDRPVEGRSRVALIDADGEEVGSLNLEATDLGDDDRALFELGEEVVWDSPADVSLEAAVEAFALQALDLSNVAIDHDGTTDGPVWVTMTDTQGRAFDALFAPDAETEAAWHVLQVGDGAGSLSFGPLELELEAVPDHVDHAELWIGGHGQTRMIELGHEELTSGTVDLREHADLGPDGIAATLVVYLDATGSAWDADGGHFPVSSNDG